MTDQPLAQRFAEAMGQLLGPDFPSDIGLAVSGGGDSMAMLYLAHNWTRDYGVRLWVVTIDHGLRPESASEAAMVAEECTALGWPHAALRWHWGRQGNVQDAARRARLSLIDQWRGDLKHVLFAHTEDDQAETVLMRLARGSGVDGLAGMRPSRHVALHPLGAPSLEASDYDGTLPPQVETSPGFSLLRPCLEFSRSDLRHYATALKGRWVEDPTNDDRDYDRVRIRQLLNLLGEEGITPQGLAATAQRMARAQVGLKARLADAVTLACRDAPLGQVLIDRDGFATLDTETQLRLLTQALCYVASSRYRPRASASEALLQWILSGGGGTLHGAEVLVDATQMRVVREYSAVKHLSSGRAELWDNQWADTREVETGFKLKALGDLGWQQVQQGDGKRLPYRAALSSAALWEGENLIACPALEYGPCDSLRRYVLGRCDTGFKAFCNSH